LLQLAQELMVSLGFEVDLPHDEVPLISVAAEPAAAAGVGTVASTHGKPSMTAATGTAVGADRPPGLGHGALQLRIAVHVGSLHASVVGARRPRYRLLGPAVHMVKRAAAAAPVNSVVVTEPAALQLLVAGVHGLQALSTNGIQQQGITSSRHQHEKELWLYRAARGSIDDGGSPAEAGRAADSGVGPGGGGDGGSRPPELPLAPSRGSQLANAAEGVEQQQQQPALDVTGCRATVSSEPYLVLLDDGPVQQQQHKLQQPQQQQQQQLTLKGVSKASAGADDGVAGATRIKSSCSTDSSGSTPQGVESARAFSNHGHQDAQASLQHNGLFSAANGGATWPAVPHCTRQGSIPPAALPLNGDVAALWDQCIPGWHLGPAEAEELLLLQREIHVMQQQLTELFACRAATGAAEVQQTGAGKGSSGDAARSLCSNLPADSAIVLDAATRVCATGSIDSSSAGVAPQGHCSADSCASYSSSPHHPSSSPKHRKTSLGKTLSKLLRRRSKRAHNSAN
jgi:hypothetical protein